MDLFDPLIAADGSDDIRTMAIALDLCTLDDPFRAAYGQAFGGVRGVLHCGAIRRWTDGRVRVIHPGRHAPHRGRIRAHAEAS